MITKDELIANGYEVLPQGGWIRLSPDIIPHDWHDICSDFGVNSDCQEIILAVCGVKEIQGTVEVEEDEVPSIDVSKCEPKEGDEDSFSNLGG